MPELGGRSNGTSATDVTTAVLTQYHHGGPTEGPNADAGAVGLTSSKTGPMAVNYGGPEPVRTEATTAPPDRTTQIAPTATTVVASARSPGTS